MSTGKREGRRGESIDLPTAPGGGGGRAWQKQENASVKVKH